MFFAGQVEEENQGDQVNLENNHCNRGCAIRSCGLHWPAYMVDVCARVLMTGFIWFVFLCASQGETHGLQVASVDCRWVSQSVLSTCTLGGVFSWRFAMEFSVRLCRVHQCCAVLCCFVVFTQLVSETATAVFGCVHLYNKTENNR